jgi:CheY-like chemotaxis protein
MILKAMGKSISRYETVLEGKWALVVEDDAHSLVAISSLLRDLGIRFKRNTTGANVPQQIYEMKPFPDFVLMNLDLASGEAFTIQQRIQSTPMLRSIPVIALASGGDFKLREQVENAGFAALVFKPLPRNQFGDLLERILADERV